VPVNHVINLFLMETNLKNTHFGHEDEFTTQTIVRIGIVMINRGDRYFCLVTQIVYRGYFRLGLQPWHESTCYSSNDVKVIDQGN